MTLRPCGARDSFHPSSPSLRGSPRATALCPASAPCAVSTAVPRVCGPVSFTYHSYLFSICASPGVQQRQRAMGDPESPPRLRSALREVPRFRSLRRFHCIFPGMRTCVLRLSFAATGFGLRVVFSIVSCFILALCRGSAGSSAGGPLATWDTRASPSPARTEDNLAWRGAMRMAHSISCQKIGVYIYIY